MIIERNTLLTSIRRVGLYASKATNQIRLKISGSELNITAEDIDFSNEAKEKLTCQYEGEDIEIGFNAKFLMDMLSNLDSDEVSLEMSTPNRAGILLPGNAAEDKSQQLLMLVMPVMINN